MSDDHPTIEARLGETLRAAAIQVDPATDGFERIREQITSPEDTTWDPRRPVWLAAAAVFLVVAVLGLARLAEDEVQGTAASGLDDFVSADGRLFLLPPEGTDLSGLLRYSTEPTADEGTAIVVGRPTDSGFEDLSSVAHLTTGPTFAGSGKPTVIAGRDVIQPSYDLPGSVAAEELPDGTWIEYSTGFGATELAELVAATSYSDDGLSFATTPSGIEIVGSIADISRPRGTLLTHHRQGIRTDGGAVLQDWFTIITMPADDDELLSLAVLAASVDRIEIQGQPGYLARFPEQNGQPPGTGLTWLYPTGHIVSVLSHLPQDQAIEFAEQLRIVHEGTWKAELSSIGQETPDEPSD